MDQAVDTQNQPDGKLLSAFAATRSEEAFAELVRRHGRLVFGTCYRVLGHTQDAEDAAQAVFLTLARHARKVHAGAPLSGWLHRVAWRIALDARKMAQRSQRRDQEARLMASDNAVPPEMVEELEELRQRLDEEIETLPAKYRLPILLHHFERRTKEETAQLLRENSGTVATRLARGRKLLRDRLARRGVLLSTATMAILISRAPEPSLAFLTNTAQAAGLTGSAAAAAGLISPQAEVLCQGMMKMLLLGKFSTIATVVGAVLLVGGATVALLMGTGSLLSVERLPLTGVSFVTASGSTADKVEPQNEFVQEGLSYKLTFQIISVNTNLPFDDDDKPNPKLNRGLMQP
jgi:RNA polymerase sigma factor (sigma-70 family)